MFSKHVQRSPPLAIVNPKSICSLIRWTSSFSSRSGTPKEAGLVLGSSYVSCHSISFCVLLQFSMQAVRGCGLASCMAWPPYMSDVSQHCTSVGKTDVCRGDLWMWYHLWHVSRICWESGSIFGTELMQCNSLAVSLSLFVITNVWCSSNIASAPGLSVQ